MAFSNHAMKRTLLLLLAASSAGLLSAQEPGRPDVAERLAALERAQADLKQELARSREENRQLGEEIDRLRAEQAIAEDAVRSEELSMRVNALSASLEDANWSRATKSGLPIRFYGFLRFDTYYQTGRTNNVVVPFWVLPESSTRESNDDTFAFDVRLTRFAFDLDAGTIGDAKVTGKLETDFANFPAGVPESRATPRIRLAYIDVAFENLTIRMGQDWDIISPLFGAVNHEGMMWNVGNLGDRRPQLQFRFHGGDPEATAYTFRLGLGLTGAVDNADLDAGGGLASTERDGFDAGHPHVQARAGIDFASFVDGQKIKLGAWGAIARLETDTAFNGNRHFTPWTVGLDLEFPLFDELALRGEIWYGQALSDFRGNIGQIINTATGDEIRGWGGFGELVWKPTKNLTFAVGGTLDNPKSRDLASGGRDLNWAAYLATSYNWGGGLRSGLDLIYWETQYQDTGLGNMIRINFYTVLTF